MERITRKDVNRIAQTVSESLKGDLHVVAQGRNGYVGIDLFDATGMVDTLHLGTTRECYTYLQGMRRYSLIIGRV